MMSNRSQSASENNLQKFTILNVMAHDVRNMPVEEPQVTDNIAKDGTTIAPDETKDICTKNSFTADEEKLTSKSSGEIEPRAKSSLCKGDRPSKNSTNVKDETKSEDQKDNISGIDTGAQKPTIKYRSPGRTSENFNSPTRKRVVRGNKNNSPARRTEGKTTIDDTKSEHKEMFLKGQQHNENSENPLRIDYQDSTLFETQYTDKYLERRRSDCARERCGGSCVSERSLNRSVIGIRSQLLPSESATVRRIPSDTFAACQAAFLHSAPDEPENEDTVLLPLKVEASFNDDWMMGSMTSLLKCGPGGCLLSDTIEDRVASASGLSMRGSSLCRLLPQEHARDRALAPDARPSNSSGGSSSSASESGSAESVTEGVAESVASERRARAERPPTPVRVPPALTAQGQRLASARHRHSSALLGPSPTESAEDV